MSTEQPRRLGPLRLDSSKQGAPVEAPNVGATPNAEPEPSRSLGESTRDLAATPRAVWTWWPIVAGIVLFVVVGTVVVILVTTSGDVPGQPVQTATPLPTTNVRPKAAPIEKWTAWLHSPTCDAPCCGGVACMTGPNNQGKRGCKSGESTCSKCTSGITCIPGDCGSVLVPGETWGFHLSAVAERGSTGGVLDPCKTKRDLWLCVRSEDRTNGVCLSQVDACKNQARSALAAPITSEALLSGGFDLDVRLGGPDGTVLASKTAAKYADGVDRRSLCNGLIVSFPESSPTAYVTFYLDIPDGQ